MDEKEINIFFISITLTVLLLIMAIYFVIISLRRRQLFFKKEKENTQLLHRKELLEARQEMQQTLMQNMGAELHDSVGQKLTLAFLQMENALGLHNMEAIKKHISIQNNLIQESLDELRNMSKILVSHDFSDFSVVRFLQKEMLRVNQSGLCNAILIAPAEIPVSRDERVELTLARICQEFIQNSLKYSGCTELRVEVKVDAGRLTVICSDNGKGIDPLQVNSYDSRSGSGMQTINSRAASINAKCEWQNDKGTRLKIVLPINETAHAV